MTAARPWISPTVSIPPIGGGTGVVTVGVCFVAAYPITPAALAGVSRVLVVEQSHSGQFHRYLRAEHALGAEIRSLRHPGPLPLRPGEIHQELMRWSCP